MHDPGLMFAYSVIGSVRKRVQDLGETALNAQSQLGLHFSYRYVKKTYIHDSSCLILNHRTSNVQTR